jgi:hypothetical protein
MSKVYQTLLDSVDKRSIIDWAEGNSALLAVTKERVYIVKSMTLSRPDIKSYDIKSITSIHMQKPGMLTAGHMQIIASGVGDKTKSLSSAFDYAKDENTVMIRDNYDHFLRLEQLIYKLKAEDSSVNSKSVPDSGDVFLKLEKLKALLDANIVSKEEYEEKRLELLARI